MPKMSMTMEEGELLELRVNVGDSVKSGDILFDVATDKIDMEVESPADGVVVEIIAKTGTTMAVGAPVLKLLTETQVMSFDFNTPDSPATEPVEAAPDKEPVIEPVIEVAITAPEILKTVMAVPKARALAQEHGIDLQTIAATGPFGTITQEDLQKFLPSLAAISVLPISVSSGEGIAERKAMNRKRIAEALAMTRGIPQLTLSRFAASRSGGSTQLSPAVGNAALLMAWAKLLRDNAHINISTLDESPHQFIGVGVISESKYGLAIPVFKDPDLLSLTHLQEWIETTRVQALEGKVPVQMLNGATTSLFDMSRSKISSSVPNLLPSHTTALSIGAPRAANGESEVSLTVDLRYCDALEAAHLLDQLIDAL